jgi:hypothetical protein
VDVIDKIISPDYVDYGHKPPGHGPQAALDDLRAVDAVHTGTIAGIEPTGRELILSGMSFYKVRNGQITETRNQVDMLGLLTQLGAVAGG